MRIGQWQFILWLPEITFGWCWAWLPHWGRWPDRSPKSWRIGSVFDYFHWGPLEIRRLR